MLDERGEYTDQHRPPPAQVCQGCGCPVPWVWWVPKHPRYQARWVRPAADNCAPCQEARDTADSRQKAEQGMKAAGVPWKYRRYRWGRHIRMRGHEDYGAFRRRVLACSQPTVGITSANVHAARVFRDWRPEEGFSLYLEGAVGTGKTLFGACLTRELVEQPLELRRCTPEELTVELCGSARRVAQLRQAYKLHGPRVLPVRRSGGYSVLWVQEAELQREQATHWQRRKLDPTVRDPIAACQRAQVLVLDDMGTASQSDSWKRAIAAIIDARYSAGLPMVMTGNLPWQDLAQHYGSARTASRLREMVPDPLVLDGTDWRQ